MNKKRNVKRKIFASILALSMLGSLLTGCQKEEETGHLLDYGTGVSESGQLNTELYYQNSDKYVYGADPGILYVSEEEDPVYGGYFYMYTTSEVSDPGGEYEDGTRLAHECFRSKDMVSWERAGACSGYALISAPDDWTLMNMWAPEVYRHPEDGKYYMYYSAQRGYENRLTDPTDSNYDRLYLAVAVSDSPMGPFKVVRSGTDANGNKITNAPLINFQEYFNLDTCFACIDASMFRDTDGSLYLTFAKHEDSSGFERGIWGIKMIDPVTPDYSTVTCLTIHSQKTVVDYPTGTIVKPESGGFFYNEVLNEGNYLFQYNGKYYLTYSESYGYGSKEYNVMQAVSDNPLGPYVKPEMGSGNPVVSTTSTGMSYLAGTGHHSMLAVGDEVFTVYAHHGNPETYTDAALRRVIGIDRLDFAEIDGQTLLVCNGPTITPQYKAAMISGYKNIASEAEITVANGEGVEYLNDGYLTASASLSEREYISEGAVNITLEFPEAVPVSSIMIYNSNNYEYAFSSIDEIRFDYVNPRKVGDNEYDYGVIQDLLFPESSVNVDESWIYQGAAAIADFTEITVTKITITISQKYVTENVDGSALAAIGISDIVVLSKEAE